MRTQESQDHHKYAAPQGLKMSMMKGREDLENTRQKLGGHESPAA